LVNARFEIMLGSKAGAAADCWLLLRAHCGWMGQLADA